MSAASGTGAAPLDPSLQPVTGTGNGKKPAKGRAATTGRPIANAGPVTSKPRTPQQQQLASNTAAAAAPNIPKGRSTPTRALPPVTRQQTRGADEREPEVHTTRSGKRYDPSRVGQATPFAARPARATPKPATAAAPGPSSAKQQPRVRVMLPLSSVPVAEGEGYKPGKLLKIAAAATKTPPAPPQTKGGAVVSSGAQAAAPAPAKTPPSPPKTVGGAVVPDAAHSAAAASHVAAARIAPPPPPKTVGGAVVAEGLPATALKPRISQAPLNLKKPIQIIAKAVLPERSIDMGIVESFMKLAAKIKGALANLFKDGETKADSLSKYMDKHHIATVASLKQMPGKIETAYDQIARGDVKTAFNWVRYLVSSERDALLDALPREQLEKLGNFGKTQGTSAAEFTDILQKKQNYSR